MDLYLRTSLKISKIITRNYSTSFFWATKMLEAKKREAVFAVYGFVRLADEIVDTFHTINQQKALEDFENEYNSAMECGISINPVIHAFVDVVKKYNINNEWVRAFLQSMKMDLQKKNYTNSEELEQYIYGSADVVGLMCLKIFVNGSDEAFAKVSEPAMKLGSAFQKVNFLRDLKNDVDDLGRSYFYDFSKESFNDTKKAEYVQQISADFKAARKGISELPGRSKLAVHVAYFYYVALLKKIAKTPSQHILSKRVRVSNFEKMYLLLLSVCYYYGKLI